MHELSNPLEPDEFADMWKEWCASRTYAVDDLISPCILKRKISQFGAVAFIGIIFVPALDQLMHFNQVGIYGGPSFPISQSFDLKFLYTIMRQVFTLTSAAVFTLQLWSRNQQSWNVFDNFSFRC
jgi:hypothetical protein